MSIASGCSFSRCLAHPQVVLLGRYAVVFPLFRADRSQAECLEDLPEVIDQYDYLKEQIAPGAKVKSTHQCQKAFGPRFLPHVIPNEPPYEVSGRTTVSISSRHALTLTRTCAASCGALTPPTP